MIEAGSQVGSFAAALRGSVRLRVIGCGNAAAGDDSAGLEIARRLRARQEEFGGIEFLDVPQPGVGLLELLGGADTVLFLDAVSSGAPPGTLHLTPLPSLALESRALSSLSSHGWSLRETFGLVSALGLPIPRLALVGVEIATVTPAARRSDDVERAVQTIVDKFTALCELLLSAGEAGWRAPRQFVPGDDSFPGGL